MENKFKEGETVVSKVTPEVKLTISRYLQRVYYCRVVGEPDAKEQVYFERELKMPA